MKIDSVIYEIKEYWPRWKRILLVVVCICLAVTVVWFTASAVYNAQMEKYTQFQKEYEGLHWIYWDVEPYEEIKISVDGMKNGYGEFMGTIAISIGEDSICFSDCRVLLDPSGTAYLCGSEVNQRKDDNAICDYAYGLALIEPDWKQIAFYKLSEMPWSEYEEGDIGLVDVFTAPAGDIAEAVAVTKVLAGRYAAFEDLTWDKNGE